MKIFPDMPPEDITKTVEAEEMQKQYNKMSEYQKFKYDNHYQLATGEDKCQNCDYIYCEIYHDKKYYKCRLIGRSRGEATDIRLRNVCDRYKRR